VTRKITKAVARIKYKLQDELYLGDLEAKRDWGYAKDYVKAMWLMMQQKTPDDYVIATGENHTVKEFVEVAFDHAKLHWKDYVRFDPQYKRPTEVDFLLGDASKAKKKLNWSPTVTFYDLVRLMVDHDINEVKRELYGKTNQNRQKRKPI
jgi:GDPmannose 4,6-dehydratase